MLNVNQLDFLSYRTALKGNYRKGVHAFRAILSNPGQAADFASNLGGVSLVLGWPIGHDDRNSRELLDLLIHSSVIDQATLTWLSQWYPEDSDSWDTLASDSGRAAAIAGNPLIWRAVGYSPVTFGKVIAGLVGLTCAEYADIYAVVSSSTAMTAVAASEIAMTAVAASEMAMTAVGASAVAVAAIWQSPTALDVVKENDDAWQVLIGASSTVIGKAVAIIAGLDPDDYADMTAVGASETAMTVVAASETIMAAVAASETAMTAVTTSSIAMTAVAASETARAAIYDSSIAKTALASSPLRTTTSTSSANGVYVQLVRDRMCFVISTSHRDDRFMYGLRYLYTSAENFEAKTYTGGQDINLFTTNEGLAAYANIQANSTMALTIAYIPC